jgi:glycosyltransferase involved in cell wall biosynthesis
VLPGRPKSGGRGARGSTSVGPAECADDLSALRASSTIRRYERQCDASAIETQVIRCLAIHHYGPDPAYVGGMGSVIRVLAEHPVGCDTTVLHPTWRPNSRVASIPLALKAATELLFTAKSDIAHIHLAERGSFLREGALVVLARIRGQTTVATIHGSGFLPFAQRYPWLVAVVLRRTHLITCLDEAVLNYVGRLAPNAQVELVPNPVPMDDGSCGADETGEVVVFAGEIGLRKGADVLCQAWPLVTAVRPHARCIMVGPMKDFVVPHLDGLEVRPPVESAEVRDLIRLARVVALPSRAEGMPMILTEAMSAGRPFVSTPVGGIPDLAREGGVLVDVDDEVGLAERLIEFLADPQRAVAVGERGRSFCSTTRSVEVIGTRLRELYLSAAQGRHPK